MTGEARIPAPNAQMNGSRVEGILVVLVPVDLSLPAEPAQYLIATGQSVSVGHCERSDLEDFLPVLFYLSIVLLERY